MVEQPRQSIVKDIHPFYQKVPKKDANLKHCLDCLDEVILSVFILRLKGDERLGW